MSHHMRMYMPRGFLFMLMRGGRKGRKHIQPKLTPEDRAQLEKFWQFHESQRAATPALTVNDMPQGRGSIRSRLTGAKRNGRENLSARADAIGRSHYPAGSGTGVPAQPQGDRDNAGGYHTGAHGSGSPATVTGDNLGWEALESQLLDMVQDNPDLKEVEVKHD